jgi:hypothetical protein
LQVQRGGLPSDSIVDADCRSCEGPAHEDAFGIDAALRPKKYYGLQADVVDAARRYSPADSSGKQAPASRAPVPYLNVLCRAAKPYASDAATPLHLSCQSFSKKLENHEAAVALHVAHDNLCRVHETPRVTPAVHLSGPGTIGRRETSVIDLQACDFPAP